ncbi:tail fiber protein [Vibrio parahaemolyticus]
MSQSIITTAFEAYKAEQEYLQQPVALDEFVLAFVPGQDPTAPIDPNEGLPPAEQIVYVAPVTQDGYVNPNAVAYSLIMDTRVGDFEFNWVGLRNKANGIIAAITHVPAIHKYKSIPGVQNGNSVTRSILMSYQNAKSSTGINVDASTWQIDFTARLYGIEENERLVNLDVFGHGAFLGDGFKIAKSGETYTATNGRAYVGGLRCHLDTDTPISGVLPNRFIYLDASWQGQLISQNQTVFEVVVSDTELSDYVSEDGYQHYLTKIAETDDWGNPVDHRYLEGFAQYYQKHELDQLLNLKVDKRAITHDINSTSSSNVASGKAVGDVKRLLDSHKSEGNPHPQYWHNDEVASNAEAIAGATHSKILTALRGMEMLKSRISSSLSGVRADYAASESALKAAYDKAVSAYNLATSKWAAVDASTSQKGIVQLTNATNSTSVSLAATASAAKSAYDRGSLGVTNAATAQARADAAYSLANGKWTAVNGSTSAKGIVQLSTSVSSTSTTLAATPSAVKQAYDLAASKMTKAQGDSYYLGKTAKAADSDKLDGLNSSDFARSSHSHIYGNVGFGNRSNWATAEASKINGAVVGQLAWANYGNNHTIFDASSGKSPSGTNVDKTNPQNTWSVNYPTLMGWNGSSTYGVRVEVARYAESIPWSGVSGKPSSFTPASHTHSASQVGLGNVNNWGATTSVSSTSTTTYATASAVKSAYDRGTSALNTANGKWTAVNASTSTRGIVQLSTSVSSTSTAIAATSSAVKAAYDKANAASTLKFTSLYYNATGITVGNITLSQSIKNFDFLVVCGGPDGKDWMWTSMQPVDAIVANANVTNPVNRVVVWSGGDGKTWVATPSSDWRTFTHVKDSGVIWRIYGAKYG